MRSLLLLLCLGVEACGFSPANVANAAPTYAKPTVAARSDVPLTIILDPQAVHDDMLLSGFSPAEVHQVNLIVTRDLKSALEVYFSRVTVSTPADEAKTAGHRVIANVKIDSLGWKSTNGNTGAVGTMKWAVAMRFADQKELFYQFAEQTIGRHEITLLSDTDAMIRGAIEEAMSRLIEDMDAKGVQKLVAPADSPAPSETTSASEAPASDDE